MEKEEKERGKSLYSSIPFLLTSLLLRVLIVPTCTSTLNRMTSAQNVLKNNPMNFNALKDLAISVNLLALEEEKRIHKNVLSTPTGMVHLTDENFDDLVMQGILKASRSLSFLVCVNDTMRSTNNVQFFPPPLLALEK